ncbi:uncharacterized protein LOC144453740 [Glandiceps talaboti]
MPKRPRSNEFGGSPLQLKTHIGVRQMNESKEENMKEVYAKTRAMLFGANTKSSPHSNGTSTCNGLSNGTTNTPCNGTPNNLSYLPSGQAMLNMHGQLIPADAAQGKHHMNGDTPSDMCTQCRRTGAVRLCPCNYCDKPICSHCHQRCDNCSGVYCLFCTTVNYDDRYEKRFCVNCSS